MQKCAWSVTGTPDNLLAFLLSAEYQNQLRQSWANSPKDWMGCLTHPLTTGSQGKSQAAVASMGKRQRTMTQMAEILFLYPKWYYGVNSARNFCRWMVLDGPSPPQDVCVCHSASWRWCSNGHLASPQRSPSLLTASTSSAPRHFLNPETEGLHNARNLGGIW